MSLLCNQVIQTLFHLNVYISRLKLHHCKCVFHFLEHVHSSLKEKSLCWMMVEKLTLTWEIMSGSLISASPRTIIWPQGRYTSMSLTRSAKEITWGKLSRVRLNLPFRQKLLTNLISFEYKNLFLCDFSFLLKCYYQNTLSVENSELYGCSLKKITWEGCCCSSDDIGVVSQRGDGVGVQRAVALTCWAVKEASLGHCAWGLVEMRRKCASTAYVCFSGFSSVSCRLVGVWEVGSWVLPAQQQDICWLLGKVFPALKRWHWDTIGLVGWQYASLDLCFSLSYKSRFAFDLPLLHWELRFSLALAWGCPGQILV